MHTHIQRYIYTQYTLKTYIQYYILHNHILNKHKMQPCLRSSVYCTHNTQHTNNYLCNISSQYKMFVFKLVVGIGIILMPFTFHYI